MSQKDYVYSVITRKNNLDFSRYDEKFFENPTKALHYHLLKLDILVTKSSHVDG